MAEMRWTAEQAAAILEPRDTLLAANAGTGKTTTVVGRILWLIGLDVGVDARGEPLPPTEAPCRLDEIAAITFTEKAAYDLKEKLRRGIARSARAEELRWQIDRASIGTIHSFCGALLREHALRLGIDPTFTVLDEREARNRQDELIRDVFLGALEAGDDGAADLYRAFTLDGFPQADGAIDIVRAVLRDLRWHRRRYDDWCTAGVLDAEMLRTLWPDAGDERDDIVLGHCEALHRMASEALRRWESLQLDENVRDFDSLILDTRDLLSGPAAAAALTSIRRRYRVLIIDEFQDTDDAQRDIAFAIARGVERPQLFLVGDPKQSIYRFRGADIAVWNEVDAALATDGARLSLTRNFRSQPELIAFMNAAGEAAIEGTGEAIEAELPRSRVRYTALEPALASVGTAAVEWWTPDGVDGFDARDAAAQQVARRMRELVRNGEPVLDAGTGLTRPCRYRDIALLVRARTNMEPYRQAMARHGIPTWDAAHIGLADQQEVADVLNALRLIDDPADDLAAFAYLRSPFAGLRDEVLARIALDRGKHTLLRQAESWLRDGDWWTPPDHPALEETDRASLAAALELIRDACDLAARVTVDELIAELLDRSGYRLHLLVAGENREALANLNALMHVAEAHRRQPLGTFLDIWKEWDDKDQGLPQAPLYSADDDVVTLTTIHRAKGLEWPVVFLIELGGTKPRPHMARDYWLDPDFGPLIAVKKDDQGPRSTRLIARRRLEDRAEDARLLYVAATRARDRLVITGPTTGIDDTYLAWLAAGMELPVVEMRAGMPSADDRTEPPAVSLDWLDRIAPIDRAPAPLVSPIDPPPLRFLTSATELMMREQRPEEWEQRYVHGVISRWRFARPPRDAGDHGEIPADVRGTLIHGVLERIEEETDLADLLDEVVGELDAPELNATLRRGTAYRSKLEEEIRRVVAHDAWRWYTAGEHYRELPFLHLVAARQWRAGAFDLYRVDRPESWIIDFKTHEVDAAAARRVARDYARQAEVYREAAELRGPVRVRLHFTGPNEVVDM